MTMLRGSWDDTRMAVFTIVPTIIILLVGGLMVFRDGNCWGYRLLYIGIGCLIAEIFNVTVALFKKPMGCDGCMFNTENKFLRQLEKK